MAAFKLLKFLPALLLAAAASLTSTTLSANQVEAVAVLQTAQDFRNQFKDGDFMFDLLAANMNPGKTGATVRPLGVKQLPSLAGSGIFLALVTLEPCGINSPHVHPRGTEFLVMLQGKRMRSAFAEENGSNRVVVNELTPGKAMFFPQGLIHFQQNLDCEPVTFVAAINNEDPGAITVADKVFDLPDGAFDGTNLTDIRVLNLQQGLPSPPPQVRQECLKKCNIKT